MPSLRFEDVLPYRAADLYDLVMGIENYPKIFPDIKEVKVRHLAAHRKDVDVTVNAPLTTFAYRCDVEGTPPSKIAIRATEGAFESMDAVWRFTPVPGGGTRVSYEMTFDFGGFGLKNMIAEGFIRKNMDVMIDRLRAHAAKTLNREGGAVLRPAGP